jgi:pilus assembly protein CpaC
MQVITVFVAVAGMLVAQASAVRADDGEKLLIPVGHAQVVMSDEPVKTVVIAEPKIADAAVGSERTVVVNAKAPGTTSLVVYGVAGRFRVYTVEVFTPNAQKQVLLHVTVAEVSDKAQRDLGIDLTGSGRPENFGHTEFLSGGLFAGKVGSKATGNLAYDHDGGNLSLQATWQALEEKGDIKLLANPTIVAKNGEKADFLAGGEFPVPIVTSNNIAIDWKKFGTRVEFTPTVEEDGAITLQVTPEVSQLDFSNPLVIGGFVVPIVNARRTTTTVRLNPGENLVIGGLKQTEKTRSTRKVPILGDIPLLNLLFSSSSTSLSVKDLVVIVSPEMIEASVTKPALPTDHK